MVEACVLRIDNIFLPQCYIAMMLPAPPPRPQGRGGRDLGQSEDLECPELGAAVASSSDDRYTATPADASAAAAGVGLVARR